METWDVFISHASEDKETIVEPLVQSLEENGISCWYDKKDVGWGDSIVDSISKGLNKSKYALVVLSENFISKGWTKVELNSMLNMEIDNGQKKVLPLIVGNEKKIIEELPLLNDKRYILWSNDYDEIITKLNEELNKPLIKTVKASKNENFNKANYSSISITIDPFIDILNIKNNLPDELLKGNISDIESELFINLDNFITSLFLKNIPIIIDNKTIQSKSDFYALLIVLVTINKSDGNIKWLIKETVKNLNKNYELSNDILKKSWKLINKEFINKNDNLEKILNLAIETSSKNERSDFIYFFFSFIFKFLKNKNKNIVIHFLEKYETNHIKLRVTILKLVGKYKGKEITNKTAVFFNPNMIEIKLNNKYFFETMQYPLTEENYMNLTLKPIKNHHKLLYPYILDGKSIQKKIEYIVELCQSKEKNQDYYWDIPTIPEWLALCDCEHKNYPWKGDDIPNNTFANLHFNNTENSSLKPIGTYFKNRTEKNVYDCCGNVHELVYFSFNNIFRLMGGCYLNDPKLSSCQIIRRLISRKNNKNNIAIRLIRFHKKYKNIREDVLEEYNVSHKKNQ